VEDSAPRPRGLLAIAAISATVNVLLAGRMPPALNSFREMFVSFGVDPPPVTKLVMNFPHLWWLLGVVSLAVFVWVAVRSKLPIEELRRMKFALRLLIILTALVYGLAAWALYTPIFELGAVV
jgi:type II secretory pathway component PulF